MLELVREHHDEQDRLEQDVAERRRRGVTFRELVREWLVYLERERGARPSTGGRARSVEPLSKPSRYRLQIR